MTELARPGEPAAGALRPAPGLGLLGEYQGSGFTEPRYLVRRGDGQVIQLSRLLYLVVTAIAAGGADGGWDAGRVAVRVGADFGRELTADNIRYLVAGKLAPLGVVLAAAEPGQNPVPRVGLPQQAPRANLLLGLRIRGVLLRPRAAGAVGGALAWLHYPALVAAVLAGFAAFEAWLFAVHGAIGPLLGVLRQPVLFIAIAGLTLASLLFHEFGHASACRYGGARPGAIGFGLYLVWPALYTDVTDAYRLGRAGRLRTDLGGVYFNAIFVLAMAGCYAATGQPVFLAAAFLGNFEILQQLVPLIRMDGYFILADLAGIPDLLGFLIPIMASLMPGAAARRARARVSGLRRSPRVIVTTWVLLAVPLLAAITGYTLWNLPVMAATAERSFTRGLAAVRAGFAAGHPAAGLAGLLAVVLLVIPAAGLAYLIARLMARGAAAAIRPARLSPRLLVTAITAVVALAVLVAGLGLAGVLTPAQRHPATAAPAELQPQQQSGASAQPGLAPTSSARHRAPRTAAPVSSRAVLPGAVPPAGRPAGSAPVAGTTSAALAGQPAVTPGPASAAAAPGASPAPAHPASPAPGGSSPPGGGSGPSPSPSPSCVISLLGIGVLCL